MDPVGNQKKIKSDSYHIGMQKLVNGGGAKSNYGYEAPGNKMKKVSSGQAYDQDQGTVKGGTKHTYKVGD